MTSVATDSQATPPATPALRLDPMKGPAGWLQLRGNREGWARLAELCRALAESEAGSDPQDPARALQAGRPFLELFTPTSRFQVAFCATDDRLTHDAPPVDLKSVLRRDRWALLGCGLLVSVAAVLAYVFALGAAALVGGQ